MFKLFVRVGVTTALAFLMIYLYLLFITVHQESQPLSDVKIETTVREKTIAAPGETADVRWVSPYESKQWVVVFQVDRVLRGRFEEHEIRFLVHSPSRDLGVREEGQHLVLERRGGERQRPDPFSKGLPGTYLMRMPRNGIQSRGYSSLAALGLQLLLQPAGFCGIKRRVQRLAVVNASLIARALVDRVDHRLEVQGDVRIGLRQRYGNRGRRHLEVYRPDLTEVVFLCPG